MTCYARKELQTAKNESTLIALADFLVTQVLPTRRNLPKLCKLARENKAKHPLTGWGGGFIDTYAGLSHLAIAREK